MRLLIAVICATVAFTAAVLSRFSRISRASSSPRAFTSLRSSSGSPPHTASSSAASALSSPRSSSSFASAIPFTFSLRIAAGSE